MTAEADPQIGIADLANALKVIDAAAERGAFKGNELTAVGAVRDKIDAFLRAVAAKEEAAKATEETPEKGVAPEASAEEAPKSAPRRRGTKAKA